ncbi:MAG: response regulator [Elusimicrobiota bacterium]|jgi:two-component system cell cycle response regulator DivK
MSSLVLVVDDDADNRAVASAALRAAGFRVALAEDGAAGLALARVEVPALVLMDMGMPVLDGWEATRLLKADPVLKAVPVLAFTAFALAGDSEKARAAGCDGVLSKPCAPANLVGEVRRLIAEGGPHGDADIRS